MKSRSIDYVMHYTDWELGHLIQSLDKDKTQTGKRLLKRMIKILDSKDD